MFAFLQISVVNIHSGKGSSCQSKFKILHSCYIVALKLQLIELNDFEKVPNVCLKDLEGFMAVMKWVMQELLCQ